jgi:hypothetical protein
VLPVLGGVVVEREQFVQVVKDLGDGLGMLGAVGRSQSSSVWNAARSATGGRAASRIVETLGSVGWLDMVKSVLRGVRTPRGE